MKLSFAFACSSPFEHSKSRVLENFHIGRDLTKKFIYSQLMQIEDFVKTKQWLKKFQENTISNFM